MREIDQQLVMYHYHTDDAHSNFLNTFIECVYENISRTTMHWKTCYSITSFQFSCTVFTVSSGFFFAFHIFAMAISRAFFHFILRSVLSLWVCEWMWTVIRCALIEKWTKFTRYSYTAMLVRVNMNIFTSDGRFVDSF